MADGKLFQTETPATGNARLPLEVSLAGTVKRSVKGIPEPRSTWRINNKNELQVGLFANLAIYGTVYRQNCEICQFVACFHTKCVTNPALPPLTR